MRRADIGVTEANNFRPNHTSPYRRAPATSLTVTTLLYCLVKDVSSLAAIHLWSRYAKACVPNLRITPTHLNKLRRPLEG